jgi:hypothetical protein
MARICEDFKTWVEEEVEAPIEEKRSKTWTECKKKKCKRWCLCCNRWWCAIVTAFFWFVRWVLVWVLKWVLYVICRIVSVILTLLLTALNLLFWPIKYIWCSFWGDGDLDKLPRHAVFIEVLIVDYDDKEKNPVAVADIEMWISNADRILRERARISVKRSSAIRRMQSKALYRIDASGGGGKTSEYLKGVGLLLGRNSWRNLIVYVVRTVEGAEGLHLPLYGSVFVEPVIPDTTLCHELGHALLTVGNTYHDEREDRLMHTPPQGKGGREPACGWPAAVPTLSRNERCAMRRSRWLEYSWAPIP